MGLVQSSSSSANKAICLNIDMISNSIGGAIPHEQLPNPADIYISFNFTLGTREFYSVFGIPVTIESDQDAIIVSDYKINMYGVGNTIDEAIEDYKVSITEYFKDLQENENNLGDNLKQHLNYLHIHMRLE